jgi:hypothetical protein
MDNIHALELRTLGTKDAQTTSRQGELTLNFPFDIFADEIFQGDYTPQYPLSGHPCLEHVL